MKSITWIMLLLLCACAGKEKNYIKASDALDAGREYIRACMEGDFDKAAFYLLPTEPNRSALKATETAYRSQDKEGRQQLRAASVQINGIKDQPDGSTEIYYSYSFDKQPRTLKVVNNNGTWQVDAAKN